MSNSKIEWTDKTWNPTTGCTKVSDGCKHCYAERIWPRLAGNKKHVAFGRRFTDVQCHPERLEQPLHWKKPRMVFVNSMSDLFHEDVPFNFIDKVFAVMALSPDHTFQVLTKRSERMHRYCSQFREKQIRKIWWNEYGVSTDFRYLQSMPNVWLGVSVEDQQTADERIPLLLQTPAAVRFVSAEPLLGPVDSKIKVSKGGMTNYWIDSLTCDYKNEQGEVIAGPPSGVGPIDWVICGGESGSKARPMHPDWARSLRDQCKAAGVAFFMKQMHNGGKLVKDVECFPEDLQVREFPHEA